MNDIEIILGAGIQFRELVVPRLQLRQLPLNPIKTWIFQTLVGLGEGHYG